MIDQIARINELCKTELKKLSLGDPVGVAVTLSFAPVQTPTGQTGLFLSWVIMVTLKSPLLGYDDIAFPVVIPTQNNMPPDSAFVESLKMALGNVRKIADEAVNGPRPTLPVQGETMSLADHRG